MSGATVRRVVVTLVAYGVGCLLLVVVGAWLTRVLALPPVFRTYGIVLLALAGVASVVAAWRFPEIGGGTPLEGVGEGASGDGFGDEGSTGHA